MKSKHRLTDRTKLLQKSAIVAGDKVLILKRSKDAKSRPECWDLPGGNSEWPEVRENRGRLHQEDLVREIQEETGITVDATAFDSDTPIYFDTYFEADKQVYSIIANWWLQLPDNYPIEQVKISDEHTEYKWITAEELADYDFGGQKGEFVFKTAKIALACSREFAENDGQSGCCGGGCGGSHCC